MVGTINATPSAPATRWHRSAMRVRAALAMGLALGWALSCSESTGPGLQPSVDAGNGGSDEQQPVGCPCSPGLDNAVRAFVWGLSEGQIRLRVIEKLSGPVAVERDDELVADWDRQLPCGGGCVNVELNAQVLALYQPRSPPADEKVGVARVTPWNNQLLFAMTGDETLAVPRDDVSALWDDFAACQERFGDVSRLTGTSAPLCCADASDPGCAP